MKKHVIFMILLALFISAGYVEAYTIKEGTLSIGGASTAFFKSRNYDHGNDSNEWEFNIDGGYFVKDNFEIGISLLYEEQHNDIQDTKGYGISPFALYHFSYNDTSNLYLGAGLIFTKHEIDYNSDNYDDESAGYSVKAGWEYFFNPNVAINLGFTLSRIEWDLTDYSSSNDKETRFTGPEVGLKVFFY